MRTWFRPLVASLVVAFACLTAAVAADAADRQFKGTTSQQQPISFRVSGTQVRQLAYRIVDKCPGGQRLIDFDSGFPPIRIAHAKFGGTFVDRAHHATAILSGTVANGVVRGSITDRKRNTKTHRTCTGEATFKLRRR